MPFLLGDASSALSVTASSSGPPVGIWQATNDKTPPSDTRLNELDMTMTSHCVFCPLNSLVVSKQYDPRQIVSLTQAMSYYRCTERLARVGEGRARSNA